MRAAETSHPILINRFRTIDDRDRAASLVHSIIKVDPRQAKPPRILQLDMNPEFIRCGVGWIPRRLGHNSSPTKAQSKLIPLKKSLEVLESIYCCANRGHWACCVVGEAGSGKTCATSLAAFLAGIRVTTFQVCVTLSKKQSAHLGVCAFSLAMCAKKKLLLCRQNQFFCTFDG